ncbi:MAG: DUF2254 domain-containing protein [Pseudomonadota bacterium]|nr:DUF2254 domain-containing protein [Pseudomonadota bacterium]
MNGRLRARLQAVRTSYWFVPSLMALVAVMLGAAVVWLDVWLGTGWLRGVSWYQRIQADGAREVLSTIAGSMITVAGVVFSITIVALSFASSQYGPRVLTNFMSDRGNTVTLGTFIATFLYCLTVLRTIRAGQDEGFTPQLAVMVGMVLALCSIGVLIYFIHHVPHSTHINNIVAGIGKLLVDDAAKRFPELIGEPADEQSPVDIPSLLSGAGCVRAATTGYIQEIDDAALLACATEADVLIRLRYRPGDFIMAGRVLADVAPANAVDKDLCDAVRDCFSAGNKRTPEKDIMFLVSELVEIEARALSPGVNDPMTAVTCLDWLGAGGSEFGRRELPHPVRVDDKGVARVIALPVDFERFVEHGFGRLRHYVAADMIAGLHLLRVIVEVAAECRRRDQVDVLREEVVRFAGLAEQKLKGADLRAVQRRVAELVALLARGLDGIDEGQAEWLGGSA